MNNDILQWMMKHDSLYSKYLYIKTPMIYDNYM